MSGQHMVPLQPRVNPASALNVPPESSATARARSVDRIGAYCNPNLACLCLHSVPHLTNVQRQMLCHSPARCCSCFSEPCSERGVCLCRLESRLKLYGLCERKIKGDGACQFRSVSDQLYRTQDHHLEVALPREAVDLTHTFVPKIHSGGLTMRSYFQL